jgi:hypothetical protein
MPKPTPAETADPAVAKHRRAGLRPELLRSGKPVCRP